MSNSSSMEHIPAKKKFAKDSSYAKAADHNQVKTPTYSTVWKDHDLRIYRSNFSQLTISRNDYDELSSKLVRYTYTKLKEIPELRSVARSHQQYYQQEVQCGVIECGSDEACSWYKQAIQLLSKGAFRAWTKDEKANAFIKIFVPPAFHDLEANEYVDSATLFYPNFPVDQWVVRREYQQKRKPGEMGKPSRILVVELTPKTLGFIKAKSSYSHNGVWKLPGMLSTMKFVMAREADLKGPPEQQVNVPIAEAEAESVAREAPTATEPTPRNSSPSGEPLLEARSPVDTLNDLKIQDQDNSNTDDEALLNDENDDHTPGTLTDWNEQMDGDDLEGN